MNQSDESTKRSEPSRRRLVFSNLEEANAEAQRLLSEGYVQTGNWTLGQMCHHLRLTHDASMRGYPGWMAIGWPMRPLLRRWMLPKLLRGDSPAGVRTAGIYVPPSQLDDQAEVLAYQQSVQEFLNHQGELKAHPGFGKMTHDEFNHFHAAHAGHHFGFLVPAPNSEQS